MTNQEPGAPEPLTSEAIEEAIRGWWNDTMRKDWRTLLDDTHSREWVLRELAQTIELATRAALSHPESDTRGLDAECGCTERWDETGLCGYCHHPNGVDGLWTDTVRDQHGEDGICHARLSASPDLSIDREGGYEPIAEPMVRAMTDVLAARGPFFHALLDEHPDRFVPILADAALTAIRGTTQPEPTE